jgi:hypothetical protein
VKKIVIFNFEINCEPKMLFFIVISNTIKLGHWQAMALLPAAVEQW